MHCLRPRVTPALLTASCDASPMSAAALCRVQPYRTCPVRAANSAPLVCCASPCTGSVLLQTRRHLGSSSGPTSRVYTKLDSLSHLPDRTPPPPPLPPQSSSEGTPLGQTTAPPGGQTTRNDTTRPPATPVFTRAGQQSAYSAPPPPPPPGRTLSRPIAADLRFVQGSTQYAWRPVSASLLRRRGGLRGLKGTEPVLVPTVLHYETRRNRFRLFGMPKGYPVTTAEGFQRFFYLSQVSSFVSNFAASIGYQSLLSGFFLASSPQLWMMKDLGPALMAAYFANKVVSYENRPKFWFVVSVFMTNVSVMSDMLVPTLAPAYLLPAAIVTATVKQSAALMYFVTRAAALQHFAINNNLAELTKKFNSFGIVNNTVAVALGIVFCTYIATNFWVQLATVVACCAANMVIAPMSMNPIAFCILNFTTMPVIMRAFIVDNKVLSPEEVSAILGMKMQVPPPLSKRDCTGLISVSPPISQLVVRTDTLEDDVLYVHRDQMFMLGFWEHTPVPLPIRECWQRNEMPECISCVRRHGSLHYWRLNRVAKYLNRQFQGRQLTLLVHQACPPEDLFTAYVIMHTACLEHADTTDTLCAFVRQCQQDPEPWIAKGAALRRDLKALRWDTRLVSIDHPHYRMSELMVPKSFLAQATHATGAPSQSAHA